MSALLPNGAFRHGERATLVLMASAVCCMLLSIVFGALGALYYIEPVAEWMKVVGVSLVQLRPLHTTFASAWIYLAAVACVHKYLYDRFGEPSGSERRRFRVQMVCWGLAGLGVLVTLPFGITSGREYLGFHPLFSALIAVGWLCFAWTFVARIRKGFWSCPVYVYMWGTGVLLFLWTFAEGHAWMLPFVRERPVADLQIQWKSCGTLVAAFNQMVYGSLLYIGERRSGDRRVAQSWSAFALFGIGLLNSFTNYAHHTYHLPQSHLVKWVAFVVSMLEIIILVKVFQEVTAAVARAGRTRPGGFGTTECFFTLSRNWNLFMLTVAILISIPPLNALIHGTHVVMAHAMGSELAIDTYILLAVFAAVLADIFPKREVGEELIDSPAVRRSISRLNLSLMGLVALLLVRGLTTGVTRYLGLPEPEWVQRFPFAFVLFGMSVGWFLLHLLAQWAPLFLDPTHHKRWRD